VVSRLAIGGMLLAILALGALAVWANLIAQGHTSRVPARGRVDVGHLRATQALGQIDKYSEAVRRGDDQAQGVPEERMETILDAMQLRQRHPS
jgi:hypothetical protein